MPKRLAILLTPLVVLLASPAGAFALNINDEYRPQDEFELKKWIPLGIFSINKAVLYVVLAAAVSTALVLAIALHYLVERRLHDPVRDAVLRGLRETPLQQR